MVAIHMITSRHSPDLRLVIGVGIEMFDHFLWDAASYLKSNDLYCLSQQQRLVRSLYQEREEKRVVLD